MTKIDKTLIVVLSLTLTMMLMTAPGYALDDVEEEVDFTIEAEPMANIIPEEIEFTLDLDMEDALDENIQTGSVDVTIQNNTEVDLELDQEPKEFENIDGLDSDNLLDKGIYYYVTSDDEDFSMRFGPGDTGERTESSLDKGERELEIEAKFGTTDMHNDNFVGNGEIDDDDVPLDKQTLEDEWYELPAGTFDDVILEITVYEA